LIIAAPGWALLNEIVPFLKGFTLFFWAAGTWWIPLLIQQGMAGLEIIASQRLIESF